MPSEAVALGPFVGGMNTLSDPTGLEDDELVDIVNFELDLDGSLVSRPPIYTIGAPSSGGVRPKLLGWFISGATLHLLASNNSGLIYYSGGVWASIPGATNVKSTAMVQYEGKAFVVATPDSTADGGYWNGTTWTAVAAIPRGGSAVVHKERMYITPGPLATGDNASLLRFSDPANFTTGWAAGNAAFIGKGDGQKLIDILVYNDNLMMFKNDSTYVYAFDNTPLQGVVRMVNTKIGAYDKNCVESYENSLYVLHNRNLYEVTNYDFEKINYKVPFTLDTTKPGEWADPVYITNVGDRLIVKYYARIYVYGLKTKTWSRWDTGTKYIGPFVKTPVRDEVSASPKYICASAANAAFNVIYQFEDAYDNIHTEAMTCKILTKNYDFSSPYKFKRLFWWGADVANQGSITGIATPIVVNFAVTWGMLKTTTWGAIKPFTWGQPLTGIAIIQTDVTNTTLRFRKFVKFLKSIRFRQINFEVRLTTDGTTITSPARIFTLSTLIDLKETVSKSLS